MATGPLEKGPKPLPIEGCEPIKAVAGPKSGGNSESLEFWGAVPEATTKASGPAEMVRPSMEPRIVEGFTGAVAFPAGIGN